MSLLIHCWIAQKGKDISTQKMGTGRNLHFLPRFSLRMSLVLKGLDVLRNFLKCSWSIAKTLKIEPCNLLICCEYCLSLVMDFWDILWSNVFPVQTKVSLILLKRVAYHSTMKFHYFLLQILIRKQKQTH